MARVRILTAPRSVGEMKAEELLEQGLPVTHKFTELETEMYPSGLVEVWLEDETLLEDEEVRRKIEDVIGDHPLQREDEDKIAAMPFQDVPEGPVFRLRKIPLPALVIGTILLLSLGIWFVAYVVSSMMIRFGN